MNTTTKTVEASGMLSTENKANNLSATMLIAQQLLKQVDESSHTCMMWLIMSVGKMLSENPELSLHEFYNILAEISPERYAYAMVRFAQHYKEEGNGDL